MIESKRIFPAEEGGSSLYSIWNCHQWFSKWQKNPPCWSVDNNLDFFDKLQLQVNIEILNVDDNAPKFENISQVELPEDIGVGQPVVQFKATDKDGSTLTFSIIGGNTENKFVVDRNTGIPAFIYVYNRT